MKKILSVLVLILPAFAAQANALKMIKDIEGVYKQRFTNAMMTPGKAPFEADQYFQSEDIIEVMRHDDQHIYLRAELNFYNGHTCSIYGIARFEKNAFVYRVSALSAEKASVCTLTVTPTADSLRISDRIQPDGVATCRAYCGVRGSLSDLIMPMKVKRPIRYQTRILKSRQYQSAVAAFQQAQEAK